MPSHLSPRGSPSPGLPARPTRSLSQRHLLSLARAMPPVECSHEPVGMEYCQATCEECLKARRQRWHDALESEGGCMMLQGGYESTARCCGRKESATSSRKSQEQCIPGEFEADVFLELSGEASRDEGGRNRALMIGFKLLIHQRENTMSNNRAKAFFRSNLCIEQ